MAEQFVSKYIPAGCLLVRTHEPVPELLSEPTPDRRWYFFKRELDNLPGSLALNWCHQTELLELPCLAPFSELWKWEFVQFAFARHTSLPSSQVLGKVRVYILPQDARRIKGDWPDTFDKAMKALLCQLEYSQDCWQGGNFYNPQPEPTSLNPAVYDTEASLLTLFNQVPSPNPLPETACDSDLRHTMQCLIDGHIPGLTSTLYPYQGRSVALMLQREVQPGMTLDPRLRPVLDQAGHIWYYDDASGLALREPRYYDGPQGGILAEEMGTGKTLICLALVLSTQYQPTSPQGQYVVETAPRQGMASLMDMAAATANKNSVAWKPYFDTYLTQYGYDYQRCKAALNKPENRAIYRLHNSLEVARRRSVRLPPREALSKEVALSYTSLIVVPANLIKQWQNEIKKHTQGLNVLTLVNHDEIPQVSDILTYDIILISDGRLAHIQHARGDGERPSRNVYCPLEFVRFKRCIIDEGHKLGNGNRNGKTYVMRALERLEFDARWVVTGTPSHGLYGVQTDGRGEDSSQNSADTAALKQEFSDIQRIGKIAAKFLMVRPWSDVKTEFGAECADWNLYTMRHRRKDCLANTLNSLLIRHRLSDISTMLPQVHEKVTVLDGCFQDQLSLNLFSMMLIFNAVQSQRTDQDYLFHPKQKPFLVQLVKNLRQATFFGGAFFSAEEITVAVKTAEEFLAKKLLPISDEDEDMLRQAIEFGKMAVKNRLKNLSNRFRTMPVFIKDFPGGKGKSWSLDDQETEDGLICTDPTLVHAAQKLLNPCLDAPTSLEVMFSSGKFEDMGRSARESMEPEAPEKDEDAAPVSQSTALAGNTLSGNDDHGSARLRGPADLPENPTEEQTQATAAANSQIEIAAPLANTRMVSTVSVKLSYLIDSVLKYQDDEQILIFYDNDNVAFYLASVFEILQIQHLIYAKTGLSVERRAQYVATFTQSAKFRVLLMDITQAAFGLDMRSASRIYFISPVLNPQVMAQAIGRARRISQQKPVHVETLVLRNSIEEVIMDRRENMSQAEHSRIKNVLDDGKIKDRIRNSKIIPMDDASDDYEQTAPLAAPQYVFGRGFGRPSHPDDDIIIVKDSPDKKTNGDANHDDTPILFENKTRKGGKRKFNSPRPNGVKVVNANGTSPIPERAKKRRTRVAWTEE